jgi:hypothetical protein
MRSVFELAVVGSAAIGVKFWHQHRDLVMILWASYVGLGLAYMQIMKSRFEHWQCPRCHTEWPGTKEDKDPACRACGLRLHQLAP